MCGDSFVARWDRLKDTGRHLTLHYGHLNMEARVSLKIMCSTLLRGNHMIDVTRDRVVLIYHLRGAYRSMWGLFCGIIC